ncbi:hypothetical protein Tco_0268092 [Tanacetum coccineum]
MQTETKLALEQTQQGVSDEVSVSIKGVEEQKRKVKIKDSHHGPSDAMHNPSPATQEHQSDTYVFTMTMEILPDPSNKLCDSTLQAGNPVKEILLKLNLPDHRSILMDSKIYVKMDVEVSGFSRLKDS